MKSSIELDKLQLLSLYALLRREKKLNSGLMALQNQLENLIFPLTTIEELENLDAILGGE
jgi:hypothetical protein